MKGTTRNKQTPTEEIIRLMHETDNPVTRATYRTILANRFGINRDEHSYVDFVQVVEDNAQYHLSHENLD